MDGAEVSAGYRVQVAESVGYTGYRVQRVPGTTDTVSSRSIEVYRYIYSTEIAGSLESVDIGQSVTVYPLYPIPATSVYPVPCDLPRTARSRA
jgi:hypothetical protein